MSPIFEVETEQITVFHIDDEYLFSHYFTRKDIFEKLSEYYKKNKHRFENSSEDFETVQEYLADEYFELVAVDDLAPYCVVKEKYTEHADILQNSVLHWERNAICSS